MSRGFEAVFLPAGRELNGKASQTFLRHYNLCPRSAYLYAFFKGDANTVPMQRGSAAHAVFERTTQAMILQDEPTAPPELVKAIAEEVLVDFHVPVEEHDYVREMAYRFGREWTIDPSLVIACETLFVLDVGGFQLRAKIDFAQLNDNGARPHVIDYKSARAAPSYEDISRRRPDGTPAAKAFQLVLYALCIVFGNPVREQIRNGQRVEVVEPFSLAPHAQEVDLEFAFPGLKSGPDERMLRRPLTLTRRELEEYRQSVEHLVARLRRSESTGDWPAIVSDPACSECPAAPLCPIPVELRDHAGTINTADQAIEALTKLEREAASSRAIRREIKLFAKAHGLELRVGRDKLWTFSTSTSEKVVDREGMFAAIARSVKYGDEFDRSKWVQEVTSSTFGPVTLTEDDLAAEAAAREEHNDG